MLSDEVLRRLRSTQLDFSTLGNPLSTIRPDSRYIPTALPGGTFSRAFWLLDTVRDPDLILRVSIHPSVSTQGLHLEQWVNNEALARGFPTPRITHVDTSRTQCPYPFQIIEYSDGVSLRQASEETVLKVLGQLGASLSRLHAGAPPSDRFGRVGLGTLPEWDLFWTYGAAHDIEYCLGHHLVHTEDEAYASIYHHMSQSFDLAAPSLLHGDLSYDNILIDAHTQDLKSVIDWEDAVLGDPIFELAGLATFHPESRHSAFLDAYYAGRARLSDFETRFWTYYLRISLAKAVHRHRFGYVSPDRRSNHQHPDDRISLALSHLKDL